MFGPEGSERSRMRWFARVRAGRNWRLEQKEGRWIDEGLERRRALFPLFPFFPLSPSLSPPPSPQANSIGIA